jgi:uncharacterized protein (TIGR01244 family)
MSLTIALNPLCPEFAVCGQIALVDIERLASKGYRSIVNNRPDGEGGAQQPTSAQIAAEAKRHGLSYVYFPINSPMDAAQSASAYQQACAGLPHPVVAFCRSGGRAAALFQACGGNVGGAG